MGRYCLLILFNRYRVTDWKNENVLKMDTGNGCTILYGLNAIELYT